MSCSSSTRCMTRITYQNLHQKQLRLRNPLTVRSIGSATSSSNRPPASEVLTCHLSDKPPWTSYFIKYSSIQDDQWGMSSFNWNVDGTNYRILRTGCYPYIKYHCTQGPAHDLSIEDKFFRFIKVFNLGIPCLLYGIAAIFQIRHTEVVKTSKGPVEIYFLYKENKGSMF